MLEKKHQLGLLVIVQFILWKIKGKGEVQLNHN